MGCRSGGMQSWDGRDLGQSKGGPVGRKGVFPEPCIPRRRPANRLVGRCRSWDGAGRAIGVDKRGSRGRVRGRLARWLDRSPVGDRFWPSSFSLAPLSASSRTTVRTLFPTYLSKPTDVLLFLLSVSLTFWPARSGFRLQALGGFFPSTGFLPSSFASS